MKIVLYRTVVDKIYNVKIHSILEDNDNGIDYNYVAKADVVFKKVGITPFQYALQKKGAVPAIENLYELRNCVFRSYDDGVWGMR